MLLTFMLIIIIISIPLPLTLSFRAWNLPFLQILPTVDFLFFSRTDSADSTAILLSIPVFYFVVFLFSTFLLLVPCGGLSWLVPAFDFTLKQHLVSEMTMGHTFWPVTRVTHDSRLLTSHDSRLLQFPVRTSEWKRSQNQTTSLPQNSLFLESC